MSDDNDVFLEDITILDMEGEDLVLIEVKGVNENLKSQYIYQADSHRGRREKRPEFPSLLVVNSFIKSSNCVSDKLREPASEQIKLAVNKKVLIMRAIDLLNLLHLKEQGKITVADVLLLFKTERWVG